MLLLTKSQAMPSHSLSSGSTLIQLPKASWMSRTSHVMGYPFVHFDSAVFDTTRSLALFSLKEIKYVLWGQGKITQAFEVSRGWLTEELLIKKNIMLTFLRENILMCVLEYNISQCNLNRWLKSKDQEYSNVNSLYTILIIRVNITPLIWETLP